VERENRNKALRRPRTFAKEWKAKKKGKGCRMMSRKRIQLRKEGKGENGGGSSDMRITPGGGPCLVGKARFGKKRKGEKEKKKKKGGPR